MRIVPPRNTSLVARRLGIHAGAFAVIVGLGLLFLELLPPAQIREGFATSLLLTALLIAWLVLGAIWRPRPRR